MRPSAILLILSGVVAPSLADDQPKPDRPANRLARETSPYLLQHAQNPVDWFPWGPEAFEKAKKEGKPIFLSVGYSSCYWCHVMERETFEDAAIAKELNDKFVSIKVDREERPDVDAVYMAALQAYSGSGGWPMTIFLFPDGRPFYAATYLPPHDREGREGFDSLIGRVHEAYRDHKPELSKDADSLTKAVQDSARAVGLRDREPLSRAMLDACQLALDEQFDPEFGGFGYDPKTPRKPKFPEPSNLVFLLHRDAKKATSLGRSPRTLLLATLDAMARGGIRDHLAGGYHRYSTNRSWSVPHFEKMLYDNAQLASVHLATFEATGDSRWKDEAEATFAFLARTMTAPEGGFYSSLDAETEGEEGAYYVWTPDEIQKVLGNDDDFELFGKAYGLDRGPNFEGGRVVLRQGPTLDDLAKTLGMTPEALEARLAPMRAKLLAVREKRPSPRLDDKILTSWNGLAIAAYADAFRVLKNNEYRKTAETAADFLWKTHRDENGRLLRTSRKGQVGGAGYLEDYAFLAHGLLRLHAATGDAKRLEQARELTDRMMADFADPDGGFFFTGEGQEGLIARMKDPFDNALPGANSVAIRNLVELHRLTGETKYLDAAGKALEAFSPAMARMPVGVPMMLVGLDEYLTAKGVPDGPATVKPAAMDQLAATVTVAPNTKILPGDEFTITVALDVEPGWHVSANPSGLEAIQPTEIAFPPGSPLTIVKVDYPKGIAMKSPGGAGEILMVYEGHTEFQATVKLSDDALPGALNVDLRLSYQLCDDKSCLAPATKKIGLKLDVK